MSKFIVAAARNPGSVGSLVPSSTVLGQTIASKIKGDEVIVELGGGTGSITKALISGLSHSQSLTVFERDAALVHTLKANIHAHFHPNVHVLQDDARHLNSVFKPASVDCIVCCLPFKSLPNMVVADIVNAMHEVLKPDGLLVRFTYDLIGDLAIIKHQFKQIESDLVLQNFPPAKVISYRIK